MPREPEIRVGPFLLTSRIGRGGMGEVWLGHHGRHRVPVAVKVLMGGRALDEGFREQFRNEVRSVARLHHPGIVVVFDHGEIDADTEAQSSGRLVRGAPYLVMEKLDGSMRSDYAPRNWISVRVILEALLDALAHAHARGVLHRDLKLGNVLVSHDEQPGLKLADFGVARALQASAPESWEEGMIAGTPHYMAPEQISGDWRAQGPWTDLYSLGCVAWRLITGRMPFGDRRTPTPIVLRRHLQQEPPRLEPQLPVPDGVEAWLRALLGKSPDARYRSAPDAAWALRCLERWSNRGEPPPARRGAGAPLDDLLDEVSTLVDVPSVALVSQEVPSAPPSSSVTVAALRPPFPESWRRPEPEQPTSLLGVGLYDLRPVPLVGRVRERDRLWDELRTVHDGGRPRVALLHGPAGTGKSRLAEWIGVRARETGAAELLRAPHAPFSESSMGLGSMMAAHLQSEGLPRSEVLDRAIAYLSRGEDHDSRSVECLHEAMAMTGLMVPNVDLASGDSIPLPLGFSQRVFAVRAFLERVTRDRPAIVWCDDVQWGMDTLEVVAALLSRAGEAPLPVLFLLTAQHEALAERPEERRALDHVLQEHRGTRLEIGQLDSERHTDLVGRLLGLDRELARTVAERTAGNPLFAVQLVGDWVHRGVLELGEEGFHLRPGEEAPLPDDLHQAWSARVASLVEEHADGDPDGARGALEMAAALGGDVRAREWLIACHIAGIRSPGRLVDPLLERRLAVGNPQRWSFVHGMLRESLERMAREAGTWAERHRACAAMLLGLHDRGTKRAAERVASHLLGAGALEEAQAPLLEAAVDRSLAGDFQQAHALLDEHGRILDRLGCDPDDERRSWARVHRAGVWVRQGQLPPALELLDALEESAVELPAALRALLDRTRGFASHKGGHLERAHEAYLRAQAAYVECGDAEGAARASHGLAEVERARGALERAAALYREAIEALGRSGAEHARANSLAGLGNTLRRMGDTAAGTELLREAQEALTGLGDRVGAAICSNELGEIARQQGDNPRAEACYRRALRTMRQVGSEDAWITQLNLAFVLIGRGAHADAEPLLSEAAERFDRTGQRAFSPFAHLALAICAAPRGEWAAWDQRMQLACRALEETGVVDQDLAWLAEQAEAMAMKHGDVARATNARRIVDAQNAALRRAR